MAKFWTYISKGEFSVGCTGGSVVIFKNGEEVARFGKLNYTYLAAISPDLKYVATKSAEGKIFLYSLESLTLANKVVARVSKDTQDGGICFSRDGKYLIDVERFAPLNDGITFYQMPECRKKIKVYDVENMDVFVLEEGEKDGKFYVLCGERNEERIRDNYFLATVEDFKETGRLYISESDAEFYRGFKDLKAHGFTDLAKKWSPLRFYDLDISGMSEESAWDHIQNYSYDLSKVQNLSFTLCELWEKYSKTDE